MTKGSGGGSQLQQQRREVDMQAVGGRFVFLLFAAALAFVFLLCLCLGPGVGAKYHKFFVVDTAEVINSWADPFRRDLAPTGTLKKVFHNVEWYSNLPELFDPIEEEYMQKKLLAVTVARSRGPWLRSTRRSWTRGR